MSHPALEMFARYGQALADRAGLALALVLLAVLASLPAVRSRLRRSTGPPRSTAAALTAVAVAGGLVWGWELRWLGDDAFISFRYADHLAAGHGLVFNPGERVEGYTNFLWTLVLAGCIAAGLDPGQSALVLGLACFAGLIAVTERIARHAWPGPGVRALPVAALLTAAHYGTASFATSGLETMFAALLAALALERGLARAPLAAGLAGVAAALAHPDHGILYAALGLALWLDPRTRRGWLRYGLPFLALYVPYFLWRWSYYGDFWPNTYYAKSAGLSYFDQGWKYLASFAIGSGLWLVAPVVGWGVARLRGGLLGRYLLLAVPALCLYVAKIGGDFMYGRLLVPLVAPLLVAAEVGLRDLFSRRSPAAAAWAAGGLALTAVPTPLLAPGEKRWHISDERTFYEVTSFSPLEVRSTYFDWARTLRRHFVDRGAEPSLALQCVGTVGYYTGLPLVDGLGITDREMARRPLAVRGRPGHEKLTPPAYVVARGVDLSDTPVYPEPYRELTRLRLDGVDFYLARFDRDLLAPLRGRPGVEFTDFAQELPAFGRRALAGGSPEALACDAWFAEQYDFGAGTDAGTRRALQDRLLELGRPAGVAGGPPPFDFEATHRPDPAGALHFEASDPVALHAEGFGVDAEGLRVAEARGAFAGQRGAFLSTGAAPGGAVATGRLRSEPFDLAGDVMELRIAGGRDAGRLRVSLWVDGVRRFNATGCDADMFGRRLWVIAPFRRGRGILEILDDARGARGHIAIDEVVQWVPREPPSAS